MTPKEKAKELFNKYFDLKWQSYSNKKTSIKSMTKFSAKQCSLIVVNEILYSELLEPQIKRHIMQGLPPVKCHLEYWNEVKKELEKL